MPKRTNTGRSTTPRVSALSSRLDEQVLNGHAESTSRRVRRYRQVTARSVFPFPASRASDASCVECVKRLAYEPDRVLSVPDPGYDRTKPPDYIVGARRGAAGRARRRRRSVLCSAAEC